MLECRETVTDNNFLNLSLHSGGSSLVAKFTSEIKTNINMVEVKLNLLDLRLQ